MMTSSKCRPRNGAGRVRLTLSPYQKLWRRLQQIRWLDVNGSPYSEQAKFTEKIRRPAYDHLQIDMTVEDPKAYTKPWTVRVDQRLIVDQDLIEFECNENQTFRLHVK